MYRKSKTSKYFLLNALIISFILTQIISCTSVNRNIMPKNYDGPPKIKVDVSKIHDAVPKHEPLSHYGNKHYHVRGKHYKVLKHAKGYDKVGYASWYGSMFHGKLTSNREKYNLFGMTAASPNLPLPTFVQVTNLANNKTVIVKVNDRGPFEKNRLIDLSWAAAKKLGFDNHGVAKVRVVAIDPAIWHQKHEDVNFAENTIKKSSLKFSLASKDEKQQVSKYNDSNKNESLNDISKDSQKFYLQIGAFSKLSSAKKLRHQIAELIHVKTHINTVSKDDTNLYKVQIGPLLSVKERDQIKNLLENNGLGEAISVNS